MLIILFFSVPNWSIQKILPFYWPVFTVVLGACLFPKLQQEPLWFRSLPPDSRQASNYRTFTPRLFISLSLYVSRIYCSYLKISVRVKAWVFSVLIFVCLTSIGSWADSIMERNYCQWNFHSWGRRNGLSEWHVASLCISLTAHFKWFL